MQLTFTLIVTLKSSNMFIAGTSPPPLINGGLRNGVGSEISHKKGGVGKIGLAVLKKRAYQLTLTNPLQSNLSLCVMCAFLY